MKIELYPTVLPRQAANIHSKYLLFFCVLTIVFSAIHMPTLAQQDKSSKKLRAKIAAETAIKHNAAQTLKASSNTIWFQKNEGQFGNPAVLFGFRTSFGSMGVYNNKLRVITQQTKDAKKTGRQIVDITFPGATQNWKVLPGKTADVKGSYNSSAGTINAPIFNEITLKNVYRGIDLRLYAGQNGALEFDWLVANGEAYKKIKMNFNGQDSLTLNKSGNLVINMKLDNMEIVIPETYQIINGHKKLFSTGMTVDEDKNTIRYEIAGNITPGLPMVIDPVMLWSTYVHNNTSTFDEYLYTIAVNATSEVYACGFTNEAISTGYMSGVVPGYLSTYNYNLNGSGDEQSVILYRLNPKGTAITAWTYTGQTTNIPVALGIFPNNRILVVYQQDTVQIFSADLTTRYFNNLLAGSGGDINYQSQAIIDNDVFYVGGITAVPLPSSLIPPNAPDHTIASKEGLILRIKNAGTSPVAEWGTYVGGTSAETFTAIAATPDKTKLAFAVHVNGNGTFYPSLVKAVDNTTAGSELLVGVLPVGKPTAFSVFSYLGGSGDEGTVANGTNAALVAADNNYFYVAGNTTSSNLPGTAGSAQPAHGANLASPDQFLSQIPLNGSAGSGFITTYNGGDANDIVGGLVVDLRTHVVLLFGTTASTNFPVYNASLYSPFYQGVHGNTTNGLLDITYTVFANGLATRKFSTFIGGDYNDYLGSTGKLQGTGHFQYNPTNGFTYIGTTIHSDQTTIPPQWMTSIPGFDKSIPPATLSKDSHFIFAMSPNTLDYGDAPASYDAGIPASSAVSFFDLRIGEELDAEDAPNNSILADGDDIQNSGSTDDEDGVAALATIAPGATAYSVTVAVFNNTGAAVTLCGWIDTNGNGVFDASEYASVNVPNNAAQQYVVLNFTGLPPFTSITGYSFLRLRLSNVAMGPTNATGDFGKGEVEDYMVLQNLILPVLFEKFTAVRQEDNALLHWVKGKGANVQQFEVQYGITNTIFNTIASIPGTEKTDYTWLHTSPVTGYNYYRLKIILTDGNTKYSPVQQVNFSSSAAVHVYPNPAVNTISIFCTTDMVNKAGEITFVAMDGKVLSQQKITSFNQVETIDVTRFPKAQYLLKITCVKKLVVKKITIAAH